LDYELEVPQGVKFISLAKGMKRHQVPCIHSSFAPAVLLSKGRSFVLFLIYCAAISNSRKALKT
jgi:hypothetical protein